jgi:Tol biopolymer transport system component
VTGLKMIALAITAALLAAVAPAHAAFPGENGKLILHAGVADSPEAGDDELFTINPDGSGLERLTDNAEIDDLNPAYSPDGRTIAYTRNPGDGSSTGRRLSLMDADGSNLRDLAHGGFVPAWSPDGQSLAFHEFGQISFDVYTAPVAGGPRFLLTQAGSHDFFPAWSPTADTIAFASNFNTVNWQSEIYATKADGSEDWVQLTNTLGADTTPEWSPDGSKIVFVSARNGNDEIYVMNADGSGETRLTTDPQSDLNPQWSPDGTRIAFTRYDSFSVSAEIWTMKPDGSDQVQVTDNALLERLGDWQPLANRPPDCSGVAASPAQINRHNRTFVTVALAGATDPDGDTVSLEITAVTQDEPVGSQPDARLGDTPDTVRLRAERDVRGDGRVYRIEFEVADGHGGTCTGTAAVGVPRRRNLAAVDSAPPSYDSLGR